MCLEETVGLLVLLNIFHFHAIYEYCVEYCLYIIITVASRKLLQDTLDVFQVACTVYRLYGC